MKPSFFTALLALLLAAPLSFAQTTETDDVEAPTTRDQAVQDDVQDDIVTVLSERGDFTILVDALRETGLDDALATGETFTLFAPTDAAFEKLPAGTLDNLTPEQLTGVLRYHVLVGDVPSQDAAELGSAPSVQGSELEISNSGDGLTVNDATVIEADVQASNGVIHVIDTVLLPESETPVDDAYMNKDRMDDGSDEPAPAPERHTPTDDQR